MSGEAQALMALVAACGVRAALLVVVAAAALALARRLRGEARSTIWFAVIVACLALPWLAALLPPLRIGLLRADGLPIPADLPTPIDGTAARAATPAVFGWQMAAAVYLLGAAAVSIAFLRAVVNLRTLEKRCRRVVDARLCACLTEALAAARVRRHVVLVWSEQLRTPVTWGIFEPRIALPVAARRWPNSLIRNALIHEIEHVRRCDWLRLWALRAAIALYWFNPLVWAAVKQCRFETERACDDRVLRRGAPASEYAEQLVEIMRSADGSGRSQAVAALGDHEFSRRIRAMLSPTDRMIEMTDRQRGAITIGILLVGALLGACQITTAQDGPATGPQPIAEVIEPTVDSAPEPTESRPLVGEEVSVVQLREPTEPRPVLVEEASAAALPEPSERDSAQAREVEQRARSEQQRVQAAARLAREAAAESQRRELVEQAEQRTNAERQVAVAQSRALTAQAVLHREQLGGVVALEAQLREGQKMLAQGLSVLRSQEQALAQQRANLDVLRQQLDVLSVALTETRERAVEQAEPTADP